MLKDVEVFVLVFANVFSIKAISHVSVLNGNYNACTVLPRPQEWRSGSTLCFTALHNIKTQSLGSLAKFEHATHVN